MKANDLDLLITYFWRMMDMTYTKLFSRDVLTIGLPYK